MSGLNDDDLTVIPAGLGGIDPFADEAAEGAGPEEEDETIKGKHYVHVRVQQRNGRKSLTTVQARSGERRLRNPSETPFPSAGDRPPASARGRGRAAPAPVPRHAGWRAVATGARGGRAATPPPLTPCVPRASTPRLTTRRC